MLNSAACSAVNTCSGSAEVAGIVLLLMAILVVVLTPMLLALGLAYFVMERVKQPAVLPSSSHNGRSASPMPWPTHELKGLYAPSYSEHRKAA